MNENLLELYLGAIAGLNDIPEQHRTRTEKFLAAIADRMNGGSLQPSSPFPYTLSYDDGEYVFESLPSSQDPLPLWKLQRFSGDAFVDVPVPYYTVTPGQTETFRVLTQEEGKEETAQNYVVRVEAAQEPLPVCPAPVIIFDADTGGYTINAIRESGMPDDLTVRVYEVVSNEWSEATLPYFVPSGHFASLKLVASASGFQDYITTTIVTAPAE